MFDICPVGATKPEFLKMISEIQVSFSLHLCKQAISQHTIFITVM